VGNTGNQWPISLKSIRLDTGRQKIAVVDVPAKVVSNQNKSADFQLLNWHLQSLAESLAKRDSVQQDDSMTFLYFTNR
jgi:hypothetical protein